MERFFNDRAVGIENPKKHRKLWEMSKDGASSLG